MEKKRILPVLYLLLAAILLELTVFQFSFWKTLGNDDRQAQTQWEVLAGEFGMYEMPEAADDPGKMIRDENGFFQIPEGTALLRISEVNKEVEQLGLKISLPKEEQVKATVFMRDEGNYYTYQLGQERTVWETAPKSKEFLVYPYGEVQDIYIQLKSAASGKELVFGLEGIEINGRMPFTFLWIRPLMIWGILLMFYGMRKNSKLHQIAFWPEGLSRKQQCCRKLAVWGCAAVMLGIACALILSNPQCRQNLGSHHAQYQELAVALSQKQVTVGRADAQLLQVQNPYDTIYLQANQIPYLPDYAYHDGNYYVYFGIIPELLFYLPYYLITGNGLPNYAAVLLCITGFVIGAAGLVYELMRSYFGKTAFYLYPVCVFMLVFGYPLVYLQSRPDLYHVPIAASLMFTAISLWAVLAGKRLYRFRPYLWGTGALCMAANAGCRPQFLLFSLLLIPICAPHLLGFVKEKGTAGKKAFFGCIREWCAMAFPYILVAAGIMYYNFIRFGSPFDFGATYSMTSNDMTHRGFNLSRILYSAWYYLFEPMQLEAVFPYIKSAAVEADYAGRLVSESCFGGIFACSMLYWPVFLCLRARKRLVKKQLGWFCALSIGIGFFICAADATGAGVLQRYMADMIPGIAIGAVVLLLCAAEWSKEREIYHHFTGWLVTALLFHAAFLVLILLHTEGSVNISWGNPSLYAKIWSLLQF